MNVENTTTTVEAPKVVKVAKPKAKVAKSKKPSSFGIHRDHDVKWNAKKVKVFKTMKTLDAVLVRGATPSSEIAKKSGLTERDVRHYVYHAMAAGLAGVSEKADGAGHAYFLTAKGNAVDLSSVLKNGK